jgi:hypothetical protein
LDGTFRNELATKRRSIEQLSIGIRFSLHASSLVGARTKREHPRSD